VQILSLDGGTAIITQSNDGGDDELETSLLDLQVHGVDSGTVLGNHRSSHELCSGLREVNLEGQVRGVHLDGQLPGLDDKGAEVSSRLRANAARI